MTDLDRIAREIIPPAGAGDAICIVDHEPGKTTYRAGFLVDGRERIPVGPAFDRGRDAYRLIDLLSGRIPA